MFLSSMTADAAAKHGHEFSAPRSPSPNPQPIPLHRFALNAVLSAVSFQKPPPSPATKREVDSVISDHAPTKTIIFQDPDTISHASEDIASNASTMDEDQSKKKSRSPRSRTVFNLAHPPPGPRPRQKLHVRPRVLLQLHKATPGHRPKPEFEVVPSTRCPSRFARKLGRIFKAIEKLGPDDVVVMRSDSYGPADDNESDEDVQGGEPVGVICVSKSQDGKSTRTEICMDDNSVWNVIQLRNGNYEFRSTDEHGLELKARWVVRTPKRRMSSQSLSRISAGALAPEERKFNFSTISADSRRHPVIASMTPSKIDIMDHYSIPGRVDASPGHTPLTTPSGFSDTGDGYLESQNLDLNDMACTDEALRKFILVTGVYVAFRNEWSAAFRYAQPVSDPSNLDGTHRGNFASLQRRVSLPISDTASVMSSASSEDSRRTFPRLFRSATSSRSRPTILPTTVPAPMRVSTLPVLSTRRTNSTGSAYLQRASSKRQRKRTSLPPDLAEADEESESDKEHSLVQTPATSNLSTPRIDVAPPLLVAGEENAKDNNGNGLGHANVHTGPRIRSAYLPPESTKNLWDSGNPAALTACNTPNKSKQRPTSMIPLSSPARTEHSPKKQGSIRRMINAFRRDQK